MVARMTVEVGNQRVEADTAEQFLRVFLRFGNDPGQFFNKKDIVPPPSRVESFVCAQQCQAADYARV
jgi:hypothetical protein